MIRSGKLMSIDRLTNSGVIRENGSRKEYLVTASECKDQTLPPLYSTVTFIKDEDFKSTNVAMLVQVDQLPRAI